MNQFEKSNFVKEIQDHHVPVESDGVQGVIDRIRLHQPLRGIDPDVVEPKVWGWLIDEIENRITYLRLAKCGIKTWYKTYLRKYGEEHGTTENQHQKLLEVNEDIEYLESVLPQVRYLHHCSEQGFKVPYQWFHSIHVER